MEFRVLLLGPLDTFSNSQIYGADVDKDILFSEERIETFFVDQNDLETLRILQTMLRKNLI